MTNKNAKQRLQFIHSQIICCLDGNVQYVWRWEFTSAMLFLLLCLASVHINHTVNPKTQLSLCSPCLLWLRVNI